MSARRVGILGGTFDPVHNGHLDIGQAAEAALGLTEIVVVVSNIPPHRSPPVASSYHRFAMVALAVSGRAHWRASDVELSVRTPSYTIQTLDRFQDEGLKPIELFFILGADAFAEIATWKDYPALFNRAHFAVVSRRGSRATEMRERLPALRSQMASPGASFKATRPLIFLIDAPTTDVSATDIRRRRAAGQSIAGLVPPGVQQHIAQHALYGLIRPHLPTDAPDGEDDAPAADTLHGQD